MRTIMKNMTAPVAMFVFGVFMLQATEVFGQKQKTEYVQAVATGTSTQLGRMVSVDLLINAYSTDEDKAVLKEAFTARGSEGLANALDKMSSKGRIRITGTLGFDVNYLRSFDLPDGTRLIRFVTDRPITFGEAWYATRTVDYQISIGEILISKEKGKSTGKLFPVAKVKLNKDHEIEIETYQNPWGLIDIRVSK